MRTLNVILVMRASRVRGGAIELHTLILSLSSAGIVFVTGKIQRERNSEKRFTLEEVVSRQRHLSAPKPTPVAPTDINSTTSGVSRIGTHTKESAPMPQALPLAPDSVVSHVGTASTPNKERSDDSAGPQPLVGRRDACTHAQKFVCGIKQVS
jgi:hypothetical protein